MNRFQDRKLNACHHCGTSKGLAAHFDVNGKLYFLCRGATILLDLMDEALRKVRTASPTPSN